MHRGTGRAACGGGGTLSDDRIGVEALRCAGSRCRLYAIDVRGGMSAFELLSGCMRRLVVHQHIPQPRCDQPVLDCRQALATLRVAVARVMLEAGAVADISSAQKGFPRIVVQACTSVKDGHNQANP